MTTLNRTILTWTIKPQISLCLLFDNYDTHTTVTKENVSLHGDFRENINNSEACKKEIFHDIAEVMTQTKIKTMPGIGNSALGTTFPRKHD